ncbi:aconitate hydratase AcnA [Pantoea sp. Nvir]|uniref:aconitate hydratase AcnA n=3 Tax=Pantoea sp. Nvir TaxID=2576760 RepID=UPI0027F45D51|nr:aconitate hydratase AcnA [Pantoea sp. Nvir]CAJ0991774.1 Aconitate hydratase A [Pantoea sp. Nvir]
MSKTLREQSQSTLQVDQQKYHIFSIPRAAHYLGNIDRLPKSLHVLLENLLRWQDDDSVTEEDIRALVAWQKDAHAEREIAYRPVRVLMQDFTGVPAIVDLAAMREAVKRLGGEVEKVNPLSPVDLVIDHSVTVDHFGEDSAFDTNMRLEMKRNHERYAFLRWGQKAFNKFRVVPPGTGICHQVNLEYLGKSVWQEQIEGKWFAWPDTLVGTDSHTTMINALGVLGWGVGGIEAEAAMLGQPISMLIPDVVGFKLTGKLRPGITATDLVLTITQILRNHGVVGKFVEFYGDGLPELPLADRATIANMAPEYGATCGFFPIDEVTLRYLMLTGRDIAQVALVEAYSKMQGLWHTIGDEPIFTSSLELDMQNVESSIAGPKRPQDRISLSDVPTQFNLNNDLETNHTQQLHKTVTYTNSKTGLSYELEDGTVVISAITSCTNTSNPSVLMAAGLLAKKAVERGLKRQPWVKASLAPGSKVVSNYLAMAQLTPYLDKLGFNLVGYGCTTCIGNSGPLTDEIEAVLRESDITLSAVLSGNRNFEGRIHPLVKTNWLASPPLVIAYALAGNMKVDLQTDPLGKDDQGNDVFLKDIWPLPEEIATAVQKVTSDMFHKEYAKVFYGTQEWQQIKVSAAATYKWKEDSTYIRPSPFFKDMKREYKPVEEIKGARVLAILGDSVTTDHISPAGSINVDSPAGKYLHAHGVEYANFNSYGSRRGNHEVMVRGTFANVRIRNEMVPGIEGGYTRHIPSGKQLTIYDASVKYKEDGTPLAVIAGKEYGSGSSRDWAAKGPRLQGVRVVIAESFERIHRSNLIGMGILPLEFAPYVTRKTLQLTGEELFDIVDLSKLRPYCVVNVTITRTNGFQEVIKTRCRIDTSNELTYYRNDGILHYVIRNMLSTGKSEKQLIS